MMATAATPPAEPKRDGDLVLRVALAANVGVAIAKFVAAAITGSSAMLTEAFHSVVDTANELLLLYGRARAAKPPDPLHPFGYGRELYLWSFAVAMLVLGLGASFSFYEGVSHILSPTPITSPAISFAVLGAAALFEGASWTVTWKSFNRNRGDMGVWREIRESKDPPNFIVLLEDTAALIGLAAAAAGMGLSLLTGDPTGDGIASIVIGVILTVEAAIFARESRKLLIGEPADPRVASALRDILRERLPSTRVRDMVTLQVGADDVAAVISVEVGAGMHADVLAAGMTSARDDLQCRFPAVTRVYADFCQPPPTQAAT